MDEKLTDIAKLDLPYRRKAVLREVEFESGMKMVRLVLREGMRITQVDLDAEAARDLAGHLAAAAERISGAGAH